MTKVANPGSVDAKKAGCLCPVMDNGHGRGYYGGNGKDWDDGGIYVITVGCPLHSRSDDAAAR